MKIGKKIVLLSSRQTRNTIIQCRYINIYLLYSTIVRRKVNRFGSGDGSVRFRGWFSDTIWICGVCGCLAGYCLGRVIPDAVCIS